MTREMYAVGTDSGDFDWTAIAADSHDHACRLYAYDHDISCCEMHGDGRSGPCPMPCEWCGCEDQFEMPDHIMSQRVSMWDKVKNIKPMHWIKAGFGAYCEWCDFECFADEGAVVFRGKATCQECRDRRPWIKAV